MKKAIQKQAAELNRATLVALEEAFKYAPAGSEAVVENVRNAISAAQAAYGNLEALNKRIYDTVEKTVGETAAAAKPAKARARSKR